MKAAMMSFADQERSEDTSYAHEPGARKRAFMAGFSNRQYA